MPRTRVILLLVTLLAPTLRAAEFMPPPPKRYFNDYALVVKPEVANELDRKLEQFEKETSNQILVVTFPKMLSNSSIEDYTIRVAESWNVGQKKRDNGAVLFVFVNDRKMYIQVGYGLEGALPDALAKQIIDNEIAPRFKQGDYGGGLRAGVDAMMAATKGEYKAMPRRASGGDVGGVAVFLLPVIFGIVVIIILRALAGPRSYSRRGRSRGWWPIIYSGGGGGGSWGRGGGGFGGGGGFSGGGGSFGGGGAGGSW